MVFCTSSIHDYNIVFMIISYVFLMITADTVERFFVSTWKVWLRVDILIISFALSLRCLFSYLILDRALFVIEIVFSLPSIFMNYESH